MPPYVYRERAEEGAGAHREGAYAQTDGRGRGRIQETHRSEEGQLILGFYVLVVRFSLVL